LDEKMNKYKIYNMEIDFMDYNIRREILNEGLDEFSLNILNGPIPKYMIAAFIEPATFNGDIHKSVTKFHSHGLSQFDLQIDSTSLPFMPINSSANQVVDFYVSYLNMTKRYLNAWSSGVTSFPTFINSNFMIVYDFSKQNSTTGNLQMKLKFKTVLPNKLVVLCMPIYQRTLSFDKNLSVSVY
jgi:hypothetical protein